MKSSCKHRELLEIKSMSPDKRMVDARWYVSVTVYSEDHPTLDDEYTLESVDVCLTCGASRLNEADGTVVGKWRLPDNASSEPRAQRSSDWCIGVKKIFDIAIAKGQNRAAAIMDTVSFAGMSESYVRKLLHVAENLPASRLKHWHKTKHPLPVSALLVLLKGEPKGWATEYDFQHKKYAAMQAALPKGRNH